MFTIRVDYATPSAYESTREKALLGLSASAGRPVRFNGIVKKDIFLLRIALRALGEAIWSSDYWAEDGVTLDPVITVHPDRIFFEAFSQDGSACVQVIVDPGMFQMEGDVSYGTTSVDFTAWLWAALGELRTNRTTRLVIESSGFEVSTLGSGGRYEEKVELPLPWVRGFLELQVAMAFPGTRISVRPVDLLHVIRYLRFTKAKVSPRALRYELIPGEDARVILEPWEYKVTFKGAGHNYPEPRSFRVWGRRRLRLIESLLPFADQVDIYLKGRALPSFYAVKMKGITFILGIAGVSRFTGESSLSLLSPRKVEDENILSMAIDVLGTASAMTLERLAEGIGSDRETASRVIAALARKGLILYDLEEKKYRHRALFDEPVDEARVFPVDRREEKAREFIERRSVAVKECVSSETRKLKSLKTPEGTTRREVLYRNWLIKGDAGEGEKAEITVDDTGRIIFGACTCIFFRENLMNRGPCEHMLALFVESERERKDLPASRDAPEEARGISGDGDEITEGVISGEEE